MDHIARGSFIGDLPLDPFGDELQLILDVLLEIAIRRTACHRANRSHPAIGFVTAPLIEENLARRFFGSCQQRPDHDGRCAPCQRLGNVARRAQATISDHRNARLRGFAGRIHDCRQLRHPHTGDHPRGADRPRPDTDLDPVGARIDQGTRRLCRRHIARDDLNLVAQLADALDGGGDHARMAMRRIDHDQVTFGIDQRFGPFESRVPGRRRCRHAQAARAVFGRVGIGDGFLDVLDRDQARAAEIGVDHEQLFDAPLVQQPLRFFLAYAFLDRRQILAGHQFADRLGRVFGKAHVAVGQDADELARRLDHGDPRNPVPRHQFARIGQRLIGPDRDRVDDHAAFKPLYCAHRVSLCLDGQIAVEHADPAQLRHDNRHVGFGHGVHRRRQYGDIERNAFGQECARIGLTGQHVGRAGL